MKYDQSRDGKYRATVKIPLRLTKQQIEDLQQISHETALDGTDDDWKRMLLVECTSAVMIMLGKYHIREGRNREQSGPKKSRARGLPKKASAT